MRKIVTFLWFNDQAKEAVDWYVSLFENSKILNTSFLTESVAKAAGKKAGEVSTIDFELNGQTSPRSMVGRCLRLVRPSPSRSLAKPRQRLIICGRRSPKAAK